MEDYLLLEDEKNWACPKIVWNKEQGTQEELNTLRPEDYRQQWIDKYHISRDKGLL